ncbi:MAG: sarcosine oxidase subunit gamma [Pseudomonadota bacterium]
MPDLIADPPLAAAEVTHGAAHLRALPWTALTLLAPYPEQAAAMGAALGQALPAPGTSLSTPGGAIRWMGREQALFIGRPPNGLAAFGAVTDVSDVYARLSLGGRAAAAEVLARLVPMDLRPRQFAEGRTARTLLGHMAVHLTAMEDAVEILVMRSFARSAFHEIEEAMRSVAGRAALD